VDAGFDVWVANSRGTVYSRGHTKLSQADKEYYNYSFYEMGKYDTPGMIDYILEHTGEKKLSYIAHSQGTTQMFSALSENHGQLNDKVNLFIALSPVVFLQQTKNESIKELIGDIDGLVWLFNYLGIYELFGPEWQLISESICMFKEDLCSKIN
jgi:pimeloyl-ACP methyl ester carboxylesterase